MKVPFAFPECGSEEINEIIAVIKDGWLTTGSRCAQFEAEFALFVGARYAFAVNSATAALHLAIEALGIDEGDMVLVPTFTFTATAEVVRYIKAHPVFVDCNTETFCIDTARIKEILTTISDEQIAQLKAIIPVHFGGHPCDMDPIMDLAQSLGLKVIEDAAHSFPSRYSGKERNDGGDRQRNKIIVGSIGDVTCFSFYANKTITTGEGGMLCTDDIEIAKRVKVMRLHGINRDVWDRYSTGAEWEYDVVAPGFKYNMADINAAIGIHQLRKAEKFRERRQKIAEAYYEELEDILGLILPELQCRMEEHAWYLFNVLIEPDETAKGIDRNDFIKEMTERGIGTSVHYKPLHRMTYYKEKYGLKTDMFPNAEWVFQRCVCLPIFSAMTDDQLEYVIQNIREILL